MKTYTVSRFISKAARTGWLLLVLAMLAVNLGQPATQVQAATFSAGNFIPHPTTPTFGALTETSLPNDIKLGDIDGDGDLDVLLVQGLVDDPDTLWLNDGHGNFTLHQTLDYAIPPTDPPVPPYGDSTSGNLVDLDGDDDLDVLITNFQTRVNEYIWWNDGDGNFTLGYTFNGTLADNTTALYFTRWAAVGNIDGNPGLDVVTIQGLYPVEIYTNSGTGILSRHQEYFVPNPMPTTYHGVLADVDGDTDLDLIRSSMSGVFVDVNNGTGTFAPHSTTPNPTTVNSRVALVGNLDGDTDLDMVVGMNNAAQVFLNDGSGNFSMSSSIPVSSSASAIWRGAIGDIDGDGDLDVMLANSDSATDEIFVNNGSGVFTANPRTPSVAAGVDTRSAQFADIDGDDDLDLLTTSVGGGVQVWINDVAPVTTDVTKDAVNEDNSVTFTATDFTNHFSDDDLDTLTSIQVTSLPANGTLRVGTTAVAVDDVILAADLPNLTFAPDANWHGSTSFDWSASDGSVYSNTSAVNMTITSVNDLPVIQTIATQNASEGNPPTDFTLDLSAYATDVETPVGSLTFTLDAPSIGSLTPAGGYSLTPDETLGGATHTINFTVHDTDGGSTAGSFQITIAEDNKAPVIATIPTQNGNEAELFTLNMSTYVTDADIPANTLVYTLTNGSVGSFTGSTYSWTPGETFGGTTPLVTFSVNDGTTTVNGSFNIDVTETNQLPILDVPVDAAYAVTFPISFVVSGHDNDLPANTLTYGVQGALPDGASYNPATRTFTWTPDETQIGDHIITFTIDDGSGVTTFDITFTIATPSKIYLPFLSRLP